MKKFTILVEQWPTPGTSTTVSSSSDSSRESGPHVTFASFFGDTGITASDELVNMAAGADLKPSGGGGLMSPVE